MVNWYIILFNIIEYKKQIVLGTWYNLQLVYPYGAYTPTAHGRPTDGRTAIEL